MWAGVFPAVTTKFTKDDKLDHAEMERCFALQMDAGCDGIIVCRFARRRSDAVA
jgi:dihydrodipicolinate synthase/N-acetylneuraminate lyase